MRPTYDIELSDPSTFRCDCCGGLTVRLARFVNHDQSAFAVYFASYSTNHEDNELHMLVSLGKWGEGTTPADRVAFLCRVRPMDGSYGASLGDAARSAWSDAEIVGKKLSREEALAHPLKATAFEILDEAFVRDPSLIGWLARTRCGAMNVPLEKSFGLPDDVFALTEDEREKRATIGRSFVTLDDTRFFVRCLLPVPVEGYGAWCFGLWIEVTKEDYAHVREVWNEPTEYAALRFAGKLANDLAADVKLPIARGAPVDVHVPDPDEGPRVHASRDRYVTELLARKWPRDEFETYAVRRGFL
jgi:hypothetical protein